MQTFHWYNEDYDKGYQGIVGVSEVPGQDLLIVSIQRDWKSGALLKGQLRRRWMS